MESKQAAGSKISEAKKQSVIEKLWLNYYNEALYNEGVITERERNKMKVWIEDRAKKMSRGMDR